MVLSPVLFFISVPVFNISFQLNFGHQLQLVLALAVRAQSKAGGVSKINTNINIMDVFTAHVLPEIQVKISSLEPVTCFFFIPMGVFIGLVGVFV